MANQEEIQRLRDKIDSFRERGYRVRIDIEHVVREIEKFHDVDVVAEIERAIEDQIKIEDAIRAGETPEEAIPRITARDL